MSPRWWVARLAPVCNALLSCYLLLTGLTVAAGDRHLSVIEQLNNGWLYIVAGLVGLLAVFFDHLIRLSWLFLLTASTFVRAVALVCIGSDDIESRVLEFRQALGWLALFAGGVLAFIALAWSQRCEQEGL